ASGYLAGSTTGSLLAANAGGSDLLAFKWGVWQYQLGTGADDHAYGVAVHTDFNNYYVGSTSGDLDGAGPCTNSGLSDIFVVKYNSAGAQQWIRQLGTAADDYARGVAVDTAGNIYVTGSTGGDLDAGGPGTWSGGADLFVVKYDPDGNLLWLKQLGTAADDYARGIAVDTAGNSYVTGYTNGGLDGINAGGTDLFVVKYDTNGNWQWTRQLGTTADDEAYGIAVDADGNIYAVGDTEGGLDGNTNAGETDIFIVKYNFAGAKQWTKQCGTSKSDSARGVTLDTNGIYITGWTYGGFDGNTNRGGADILLVKYNANGDSAYSGELSPAAIPPQVTTPNPGNSASGIPITQQLGWASASGATSYDVYFGTTLPGTPNINQPGTAYDPGALNYSTTYYWRIDSRNSAGSTTGTPWSFTTAAPNNDACYIGGAGNAVTITDVALGIPSGGQVPVQFNLAQQNPFGVVWFDGISFSDYAWVFIKYSTTNGSDGSWNHATLNAGGTITPTADNLGVFVRASLAGHYGNSFTVLWNYTANGVPAIDGNTQVKVYAIQMVDVPAGAYYYNAGGIGGSANNNCGAGSETLVDSAAVIPAGAAAGWPNGYAGFYIGKYEISQQQYCDFLNNLPSGTAPGFYGGGTSDGYRIDNTGVYPNQYTTIAPNRACNCLSWDDQMAYLSWAALRPMTEMEFEKAARGTQQGGTNKRLYPWFGDAITQTDTGTVDGVTCYIQYANYQWGNACVLVGWYLSQGYAPANPQYTGASPYGVADLAGNVCEHLINCQATAVPLNGNGTSTAPASWPAAASGNKGLRGGAYNNTVAQGYLKVSDRADASWTGTGRNSVLGGRPVRTKD
ncbi:MAG: SBBP repeat-containing protein, partial [Planctomycetota bacterium]